jgi:hydrogenase nickel incorporation protein HypB
MSVGDMRKIIAVEQAVLAKNDRMAELNRAEFHRRGIFVLNVLSSPGSGKTALVARTLSDLAGKVSCGVIVGDLATDNDAQRLRGHGAPVVQVTTDGRCHLEANMVAVAADELGLDGMRLLIIENVGNLVCPSAHDLGEDLRVVMLSVTEGEDKPLKYPTMFKTAEVVVVSKTDIAEAVEFNREAALTNIRRIAPQARIFEVSSRSGAGMAQWCAFLTERVAERSAQTAF